MSVDLFTYSKDLEELMLSEYPVGKYKYFVSREDNPKLYCFFGLDLLELADFLERFGVKSYDYDIWDEDGKDRIDLDVDFENDTGGYSRCLN